MLQPRLQRLSNRLCTKQREELGDAAVIPDSKEVVLRSQAEHACILTYTQGHKGLQRRSCHRWLEKCAAKITGNETHHSADMPGLWRKQRSCANTKKSMCTDIRSHQAPQPIEKDRAMQPIVLDRVLEIQHNLAANITRVANWSESNIERRLASTHRPRGV